MRIFHIVYKNITEFTSATQEKRKSNFVIFSIEYFVYKNNQNFRIDNLNNGKR